jgi:hypothetical protein
MRKSLVFQEGSGGQGGGEGSMMSGESAKWSGQSAVA